MPGISALLNGLGRKPTAPSCPNEAKGPFLKKPLVTMILARGSILSSSRRQLPPPMPGMPKSRITKINNLGLALENRQDLLAVFGQQGTVSGIG